MPKSDDLTQSIWKALLKVFLVSFFSPFAVFSFLVLLEYLDPQEPFRWCATAGWTILLSLLYSLPYSFFAFMVLREKGPSATKALIKYHFLAVLAFYGFLIYLIRNIPMG